MTQLKTKNLINIVPASGVVQEFGEYPNLPALATGNIISYSSPVGQVTSITNAVVSSSGGPVKVIVTKNNSTPVSVGFFSSANPNLNLTFYPAIILQGGESIEISAQNKTKIAQNIYGTILGGF
jgi:hypothetical protein